MVALQHRSRRYDGAGAARTGEVALDQRPRRLACHLDRCQHLRAARAIDDGAAGDPGVAAVGDVDAADARLEDRAALDGRLPAAEDLDGAALLLRPGRGALDQHAAEDTAVTIAQANPVRRPA